VIDDLEAFVVKIRNNDNMPAKLTFVKSAVTMADSTWSASICGVENCFPETVDSLDDPALLGPGLEISSSLDIICHTAGARSIRFKAYNTNDPTQKFERVFTCTATEPPVPY
jgi:hypothetical protein